MAIIVDCIDLCFVPNLNSLLKKLATSPFYAKQQIHQYKTLSHYCTTLYMGRWSLRGIYEVARCKTSPGSLIESIVRGLQIQETEAMKRRKTLERKEEKMNIQFNTTGLLLSPSYPLLGASPDAISDEFVVEIKCSSTMKVSTYC